MGVWKQSSVLVIRVVPVGVGKRGLREAQEQSNGDRQCQRQSQEFPVYGSWMMLSTARHTEWAYLAH